MISSSNASFKTGRFFKTGFFLKTSVGGVLCAIAILGIRAGVAKQTAAQAQPQPTQVATPAPVPSEPQQTSASFGDWLVRCDQPQQNGAKRVCEALQSLVLKGQQGPIAQIAFGQAALEKGLDPALSLTVLLPVNISFDKPVKLGPGASTDDPLAVTLAFRRCLPAGCFAVAKPDAALLKALRAAQKPGHLAFADASERTIVLPVSFRGLAQALDDLAKEDGRAATR